MNQDIAQLRRDYAGASLAFDSTPASPFPLFSEWLSAAVDTEKDDANAMTLATVDNNQMPHARIVLLKGFDEQGFVFYTNYQSHKGSELAGNPVAAIVFWWPTLQRQVRVEGHVEQVEKALSDRYFESRPRDSQLGAWVSQQSVEIPGRRWLEERQARFESAFDNVPVERPAHWGGYRIKPHMIEFWQGQPNRLHDRLRFRRRSETAQWDKTHLAP
ncbi:pyridoxamine 5'-phosphate oxidase [Larsenimonas suaedae]|uniref:Pyridoxine/pyridoxamine 5'-phosphate oxidase n=1 Tax=Larsenimonas suaedae TaxID=1851019 RepID=A0ABU1GX70_9GAMM|nr:pyridoxamine 5'-phosphate oxidase [Larsenimonas suaedae]MCM2971392.1 pyridoxamine 5'-phosphate oxidase [Larsenimonas suaedae]MDR5896648.1 pyridoxamine 5'-phosphate oxidase [Larsenimonas suaedae]